MTLIVENGSGVAGANSNVSLAFVLQYLTDRNRQTENGWTGPGGVEEEAACIAGTDYIENRFRSAFLGNKEFSDISLARATLTFTANPLAAEVVVLGDETYTFVAALVAAGDVLIGATLAESVANLIGAINLDVNLSGTGFEATTAENVLARANQFYGDQIVGFANTVGTAGNSVASTTTVTGASWNFATLTGGTDFALAQRLSFPRSSLFDRDGNAVLGMPDPLLFATAEYAVRARLIVAGVATELAPDPTIDPLGGNVTGFRTKVGPIEEATTYQPGSANSGTLPAYPAADRLLREYVRRGGVVIRG